MLSNVQHARLKQQILERNILINLKGTGYEIE